MTTLEKARQEIVEALSTAYPDINIKPEDFVYPPKPELGDLSLPLFQCAKEGGKNPAALAQELAETLNASHPNSILSIKAAGPYLNFFLDKSWFISETINTVLNQTDNYGHNHDGNNQSVMIEYSNGNTHKECHVGHLRNIAYGDAVNHLLSLNGWQVIPVSYINDFGGFTAKTLWFYLSEEKRLGKTAHEELITKTSNKGALLGRYYAASVAKLEAKPEYKEDVTEIMKAIESRKGEIYELWQKTKAWSVDQLQSIYDQLGIRFEHTFYENEYLDRGLEVVKKLYGENVLVKSQGAIIANLEEWKLGVLPIIRSDGTSLYPVADLALAIAKFDYEPRLVKSICVVDVRQGLYFKQLFKVLELMGYKQHFVHLGYDFVTLPDGMMSSRSGNIVTYEELVEAARDKAKKETASRHSDWDEDKISQIAEALAIGALKFEMLKVGGDKTIVFDVNEALRFDGYTAAYLQYTGARINSIFKKEAANYHLINHDFSDIDWSKLSLEIEIQLTSKIAKYPEIIRQAGQSYNPAEVARYLFELAQLTNDYYHQAPVISAEEDIKNARLGLLKAASQTLKNGLNLLGIEALKEM